MSKVVALYIRVSTLMQAEEGFSIQGQKYNLQQYCHTHNLQIFKIYIDEGITGTSIQEREGLKKLIQDARNGYFEEIITWKVSRLARNVQDLLHILKVLNDSQVTLRCVSENLATDSLNGLFTIQMMGAVAELERNVIVENVHQGIKQRLSQGWYGGAPVLGYDIIPKKVCKEQNLSTNLEINEKEAQIVKTIFNLFEQGEGYKAIVQYLNKNKMIGKRGKAFSVGVIRSTLKRRLYTGQMESKINGRIEIIQGHHEAIISQEQWDKIVAIRARKDRCSKKEQGHEFILNKVLKCPVCGKSMVSRVVTNKLKDGRTRKHYYYVCSLYQNKGVTACTAKMIPALQIEDEVYSYLESFISSTNIIKDVHHRLNTYDKAFKEKMKQLNALNKQEEKLKKRQKLLMVQFESDAITKEDFVAKLDSIKQDLSQINQNREVVQNYLNDHMKPQIPLGEVQKLFSSIANILKQGNAQDVKGVLQAIISQITVDERRKLKDIEFKIDK